MSRRRVHAKIENFILGTYDSMKFLYLFIKERRKYNYFFPYRPLHKGETVNILANGPSLNVELEGLMKENSSLDNSLVVNFFVFSDLFFKIRPKYYCLADPLFFTENRYTENVLKLFAGLNKVSWQMELFVWIQGVDIIKKYINNDNIKIVGVSILRFKGFESKRYSSYKKGIAVPSYVNVTIMGLYVLLNLGYDTINLYGVDHSFLAGLCVNDDNRLCINDHHFYGSEKREFAPKMDGSLWTMKDFVYDKYLTFVEHEIMRGYADYLGAKIINCTKDSWIDAYVRKAQIDKQSE